MDQIFEEEIKVEEGQRLIISFDVKRENVGSEIIGDGYFSPVTHFKFSKPLVDKWPGRDVSSDYLRWQPVAILARRANGRSAIHINGDANQLASMNRCTSCLYQRLSFSKCNKAGRTTYRNVLESRP